MNTLNIGIIGDISESGTLYKATEAALHHAADNLSLEIKITWLQTPSLETREALWNMNLYDAVMSVSEGPFKSSNGAISATKICRNFDKPFLGTGGGFTHMLLDYARNVCVIEDARSQEYEPDCGIPLISVRTEENEAATTEIKIKRNTRVSKACEKTKAYENMEYGFGLNPEYRKEIEIGGLKISGTAPNGEAAIIEQFHWYFIGTLFFPQLNSEPNKPHPLVTALLKEAVKLKKLLKGGSEKPETLNHRWDVLYSQYPEVYDELAAAEDEGKRWVDAARKIVSLSGKIVADIGAGTGKSCFQAARYADHVIGIEPEEAMLEIAAVNAREKSIQNVSFKKGKAADIPLQDNSVDITTSITGAFFFDVYSTRRFIQEATRITKPGGHILIVGLSPKWHFGDLTTAIMGKDRVVEDGLYYDATLIDLGFSYREYYSVADFGTVEKAVGVIGFIYNKKVIDYLRKHQKSTVKWKFRIYYKKV